MNLEQIFRGVMTPSKWAALGKYLISSQVSAGPGMRVKRIGNKTVLSAVRGAQIAGGKGSKEAPLTLVSSKPAYIPEPATPSATGAQRYWLTIGFVDRQLLSNWDSFVDISTPKSLSPQVEQVLYVAAKLTINTSTPLIAIKACRWVTCSKAQYDAGEFANADYSSDGTRPDTLFVLIGIVLSSQGSLSVANLGAGNIELREYLGPLKIDNGSVKYQKTCSFLRPPY